MWATTGSKVHSLTKRSTDNTNIRTEINSEVCMALCRNVTGSTKCEVTWKERKNQCYALIPSQQSSINGDRDKLCWVFSKCGKEKGK